MLVKKKSGHHWSGLSGYKNECRYFIISIWHFEKNCFDLKSLEYKKQNVGYFKFEKLARRYIDTWGGWWCMMIHADLNMDLYDLRFHFVENVIHIFDVGFFFWL